MLQRRRVVNAMIIFDEMTPEPLYISEPGHVHHLSHKFNRKLFMKVEHASSHPFMMCYTFANDVTHDTFGTVGLIPAFGINTCSAAIFRALSIYVNPLWNRILSISCPYFSSVISAPDKVPKVNSSFGLVL